MDTESKLLSIYDIFDQLGIFICNETSKELNCYCPFHNNTRTPAFSINIETGAWLCRNESCGEKGNLRQLWEKLRPDTPFPITTTQSKLLLAEKESSTFMTEIEAMLNPELRESQTDWTEHVDGLSRTMEDLQYMLDRGYTKGVLDQFEVGFNRKMNRIVIPARDDRHKLVGLIGRAVEKDVMPKYKYTQGFPKKHILFNLNHAKTHKSVILVEGSLDCMKVYQAGYPGVCAVLGSSLSDEQQTLIEKHFLSVIIFTDQDDAGYALANSIANKCSSRNVYYANWDLISDDKKDPGDLTDEEIRLAIDNKISDIEVRLSW